MEHRNAQPWNGGIAESKKYLLSPAKPKNNISFQNSTSFEVQGAGSNLRYRAERTKSKRSIKNGVEIKTWLDVPENCIISQHEGYPLTDPCVYYTTAAQGKGVTVYVIDHAFAIHHQDFKHVSWGESRDHIFADEKDGLPSWINIRNPPFIPNPVDEETIPLLRGTAVLSKLLGKEFGVARGVKPILVKTSDRFSGLEPDTDHIFNVLPKVLFDIKRKSAKFDVSKREAPKFIILIATDYTFERGSTPFGFHARRLSQLIQELSEMPNVAVVTSDGNHFSVTKAPAPGEIFRVEPITSYPSIFGRDNQKFPNLIVTGGTHPEDGGLVSRYSDFVRIFAPSVNISVAVPDGGTSWGGKKYIKANSTPLAAAAITGVLATLISARDYTIPEAIERVYKLAYSRRRETNHNRDNRVFPNVVYNGLSLLTEEEPERDNEGGDGNNGSGAKVATVTVTVFLPRQMCVILKRAVTTETLESITGVATQTITVCERERMQETTYTTANNTAVTTPALETAPPVAEYTDIYDAAFCKECLDSDGVTPIKGVLWIPKDCPCRKETR
ncbi:hypothetical protein TWF506_005397 [Arthrobotrys conoides]|uniref:Peptidase S8/S53 domain-containing protein n=1 Tax=Arthrobotrys conoides TaxID=74498 RepID=A0AAN8NTH2_9PEZI